MEIYVITKHSVPDDNQGISVILVGARNYNKCFS
jgi:hypothetical protein